MSVTDVTVNYHWFWGTDVDIEIPMNYQSLDVFLDTIPVNIILKVHICCVT